ncbi:MAG TPA: hypothetical protein VM578_02265 [Candidatus Saccharimonadales bacterium]|nr:hypothetical protein [Candidatus Saccharimonadales bacterium]
MAKPVTMFPKVRNEREELQAKLSDAPVEHAAALLDLYELAQVSHEHGTLDLLRGLVGASDDLIGRVASGLSKPESIRASRNLIELIKLLSWFDPETLKGVVDQGETLLAIGPIAQQPEPPGWWTIFQRMTSRDGRRGLALIAEVMNEFGRRIDRSKTREEKAR